MKTHTFALSVVLLLGTCCLAAPLPAGRPKVRAVLEGHPFPSIAGLAFSPDGALLASAGNRDGTARLWDVATGKCLAVFKGHTTGPGIRVPTVLGVAFSPDGRTLATCGLEQTIKLWDTTSRKCIATLSSKDVPRKAAFSPDGKTLAAAGNDLWT
jgi:WD40 repeat protein